MSKKQTFEEKVRSTFEKELEAVFQIALNRGTIPLKHEILRALDITFCKINLAQLRRLK